ncbi:MAG: glycosyltransferase [Proteobacteria bacterium]|nr:glycosyltransferase [Pseudomonadota bacterium]
MNASCALSPAVDYPAQWPVSGNRLLLKLLEPGSNPQDTVLVPPPAAPNGPLVSCLMVSRGRLLPARYAIECFRSQTYRQRELVIIDDNPASELAEFLAVLDDPLIRHIILPAGQGSLGSMRNRALAESRGDLVCQWDDDDLFDARRIAWQVAALQTCKAQACFLHRWTLWWPAERRIAVSGERIWEGSMLARRTAVPAYPDQRRGEDTVVTGQITTDHRVVLMNAPELYCYTIHGGNTFHYQHFLGIYNAASEFAGRHAYEDYLQLLGRRLPILDYTVALEQGGSLAAYRRPQPVPMPDRFIDPARPRPGWSPSCNEPRVSIIVRSMGRSCLADALNSLAAQSYRQLEVVVVDATGGRHPPLPASIAADVRFRLMSARRPLKRPAAANFGLEAATGEYIGFLDDDDLFDPEHVALLVRRILEPDHPDLVYASLWLVDRYHRLTQRQCNPFNPLMFQFFNLIPAISVLFHRRVIELGCHFDESLEVFEDWDFWLQLAPHVRIERIEAPTQFYFIEAGTSGCSIGLNADQARAGHYSKRVRQRWEPCSSALWREYTALVHDLLARFHDGERAELRPAMRALLWRYPEEPNIEFHLGRSYLAEGHVFSARRLYESAVSHNRSCPEFMLSLARLWEIQGSPEDALSCLEEARPALSIKTQVVDTEITRLKRLIKSRQTFPESGAGGGRIGRNEPCSCGSGSRYKHCCGHHSARPNLGVTNQLLQAECDRLQVAGIEHYQRGELPAAGDSLAAANA